MCRRVAGLLGPALRTGSSIVEKEEEMEPKQKPGLSKQDYRTPEDFLQAVRRRLGIEMFAWDLAASEENTCSPYGYFGIKDEPDHPANDALAGAPSRWLTELPGGWCWLNPPYKHIAPWAERAAAAADLGGRIAMLVLASVGSNWWRDYVHNKALVLLLNGRITFVGQKDCYPKDCALLLYSETVSSGYEVWSWREHTGSALFSPPGDERESGKGEIPPSVVGSLENNVELQDDDQPF